MERCYDDTKDLLMKEIGEIVKKDSLSQQDLDILYSAYDIIKDIYEIKEKEAEMYEDGYSSRWGMPYDDRYYNIHSYRGGNGNGGYSMNGYSMNNYPMNRDNGYSRNDGKEYMLNSMYSMMDTASNEKERTAIQECINKLKGMN